MEVGPLTCYTLMEYSENLGLHNILQLAVQKSIMVSVHFSKIDVISSVRKYYCAFGLELWFESVETRFRASAVLYRFLFNI